jgi:hypothetical protein
METPSKRTAGCADEESGTSSGGTFGFLDMSAEIGDLGEGLLGRPIRMS